MIHPRFSPLALGVLVLGSLCVLPSGAAAQDAVQFGTNLIVNGDAEAGPGAPDNGPTLVEIPHWTRHGKFQVVQYGATGGFTAPADPGPQDRGKNYFVGGPDNAASSASQTVDVSSLAPTLAGGKVTFALSAFLGGYGSQEDHIVLVVSFLNRTGKTLKTVTLGPVTSAQRKGITGLLPVSRQGTVPADTQTLVVVMKAVRTDGQYSDGSADDLSLVLTK